MTEAKFARRRPPRFELIGGNVCLDFINTLDDRTSAQPKELLKNYYELVYFGEDTGILSRVQVDFLLEHVQQIRDDGADALRRAIDLREAMYAVFFALMKRQTVPAEAMTTLNAFIRDAVQHSRLVPGEGRCVWLFDPMGSSLDAMLWPITRAAADLLASSDLALVRACSSPTCQWLFLDTSKNHRRRWCDMKSCGNRAKARKFYAKKKSA